MKKKFYIIGGIIAVIIILLLSLLVIYNFDKIGKLNNSINKYKSENKSLKIKANELYQALQKNNDDLITNIFANRKERTCKYIETYEFVDYYEKDIEELLIIIVDHNKALPLRNPLIIQLDPKKFKKDFIKNQSYVFTFERKIYYTPGRNEFKETTKVIKIEPTDKTGMEQESAYGACIFE